MCKRRGERGGKRSDSLDGIMNMEVSAKYKTPVSTAMRIKRPKALLKNLHMCTKTIEQSIDMLVESTTLQSPERRRSLQQKECAKNGWGKQKGGRTRHTAAVDEKEDKDNSSENEILRVNTKEGRRTKRKRTQVKAFSPRFKGKHLDCTAL